MSLTPALHQQPSNQASCPPPPPPVIFQKHNLIRMSQPRLRPSGGFLWLLGCARMTGFSTETPAPSEGPPTVSHLQTQQMERRTRAPTSQSASLISPLCSPTCFPAGRKDPGAFGKMLVPWPRFLRL